MGKIQKLPDEIISQIAAGEVVERPAHVVKELIENALDATATEVEINLTDYGLSKIEVIDNGNGMSKEDLLLSSLSHTTSKLTTIEDLHTITTLGFRGEALSSIASVSALSIASREKKHSVGFQIDASQKDKTLTQVGKKEGTHIMVEHLFAQIPARKKFLKSSLTELRVITELVIGYVFAYPHVNFRLSNNNKILIDELASTFSDRVENMWGEDVFQQLIPVSYTATNISLHGFIGKPQINNSSASKLLLYVNNRKVEDKLIAAAVKEAFGPLLMARAYPIGILFLEIPREFVDVNVHPTKREVRFVHSTEVFNEVKSAISDLLLKHNLTYQNVSFKTGSTKLKAALKDEVFQKEIAHLGEVPSTEIMQIHQSFLVIQTPNGMMIIDQHAAHESLLYFEFLAAWDEKKTTTKQVPLTPPVVIELTRPEAIILEEHADTLERVGFVVEHFGQKSYRITHIPSLYEGQDISSVFKDLLAGFTETPKALTEQEHHFLATLACKSAIKAGMYLQEQQRRELCNALSEKHLAYTCPHGRPVKIEITLPELARMFKRA